MSVYYNENNPEAAAWLKELITQGVVPKGELDIRSIEDVRPSDLAGYAQCHFFAGIGGWAHALDLARWDRPIWTASCPCQPFSAAGKAGGFADERHLWPTLHWLIDKCRPVRVVGEQVASPAGRQWFDLVATDCEAIGYACGAAVVPAASVKAPHLRDRLYWVADASRERREGVRLHLLSGEQGPSGAEAGRSGEAGLAMADASDERRLGRGPGEASDGFVTPWLESQRLRVARELAHAERDERGQVSALTRGGGEGSGTQGLDERSSDSRDLCGHWDEADWLLCRDNKWRPVEPGTFPLAYGLPARVGRLRGYGNAIVPQLAATFLEAIK